MKMTPQEFVDEVNRRLPAHSEYKAGMRAILRPAHAAEPTGYDIFPEELVTRGVIGNVAAALQKELDGG